jgi:hypothetical protein
LGEEALVCGAPWKILLPLALPTGLAEPRPSGSGNAKDGVIELGMLIGFPRCSPTVCFSTEW